MVSTRGTPRGRSTAGATSRSRSRTPKRASSRAAVRRRDEEEEKEEAPRLREPPARKRGAKKASLTKSGALQYADGKPKPYFRGAVHGLGTAVSGMLTVAATLYAGRSMGTMSPQLTNYWWG